MESDEELALTPPEITEQASNVELNLLPAKSRKLYEQAYKKFMEYRNDKKIGSFSEAVLIAYFSEMSKNSKSSTLWSMFSMLKATLNVKNNIDIAKYSKLRAFLKRQSDGYRPKKSRIFEMQHIQKFLLDAPDDLFLSHKVVLIFGVAGACRCDELLHMRIEDIEDMNDKLLINLPDTKVKKPRSFMVTEHLEIYRKYAASRPLHMNSSRFFFKYAKGQAIKQFIGIHKLGAMPQEIAIYLKLANPKEYTGHCLRRTSATLLVNSGADITMLERHGGWKSTTVAEGYIKETMSSKSIIGERIFSNIACGGKDKQGSSTVMGEQRRENSAVIIHNCSNVTINVNK